jgi:deazaflavin-dependent oxidoreductase (nitroreductase family)
MLSHVLRRDEARTMREVTTGTVEIAGAPLHYEVAGTGPALVLLHEGLADSRMYDDQFLALAERHHVVRYDLHGFGRSGVPSLPYSHHEVLRALLRHLGVDRAAVLGMSLVACAEPSMEGADEMSAQKASPRGPHGALKLAFKVPRVLYRLRLGWLLGHRFLLLTHRGCASGRVYSTMLEVMRYDRATGESVVGSGFGTRVDWYRNMLAHSVLEIQTGGRRYQPEQRVVPGEERVAILATYRQRSPRLLKWLMGLLGYAYDGSETGLHGLAEAMPMVGFRPRASEGV